MTQGYCSLVRERKSGKWRLIAYRDGEKCDSEGMPVREGGGGGG